MTICRLVGDPIVRGLGPSRVVVLGSLTAAGGFMLAALAPYPSIDIIGYGLVGAANVVPVMFSAAGRQTVMPANLAVPAMTTIGYAGSLIGPAIIGLLSGLFGLPASLTVVAAMLVVVGIASTRIKL
jgi:hypothetical protein